MSEQNVGTKRAAERPTKLERFAASLPSNVRPLTTLTSETAIEGQTLATLLLCVHPKKLKHLLREATPSGPFHKVDAVVYDRVRKALTDDGGDQGPVAAALKDLGERFKMVSLAALETTDNPYDEDPDKCPSEETLANLQSVGLMNVP